MVKETVDLFTGVMDWLQEKLRTKFGFFVLGALFSFLITFSFFSSEHRTAEALENQNTELRKQLEIQRTLVKEWQDKWVESEQGSMEKLKGMMEFLNELEDTYNQRYEAQKNKSREVNGQLNELKQINDRLRRLESSKKENE